MKTRSLDVLAQLVETVEQAIQNGDWKVDGRCDPEIILHHAEAVLKKHGYRRDGLTGQTLIYEV